MGWRRSTSNTIDSVSIASRANATDFGDLTVARFAPKASSNNHAGIDTTIPRAPELYSPTGKVVPRGGGVGNVGLFIGNHSGPTAGGIEYINIPTTGNTIDFGNIGNSKGKSRSCFL